MSPTDQKLLREERSGIDWSAQDSEIASSHVDRDALAGARRLLSGFTDERRSLAKLSEPDLLRALGLLARNGHLTRAGQVLLAEYRGESDPKIVYQYKSTEGGEPSAVERLYGPLLVVYQRVLELVQARRKITPLSLPDGQQIQVQDFPELAVREAIANAVIHREYHTTAPVVVEHSPAVLVVTSPGPLVSGVTADNILTHPSKPRHPQLAGAARRLGLAEEVGRGVDRMYREMIRSGRDVPLIQSLHDRVRVSFVGGAPNTNIARYVARLPLAERDDTDTLLVVLRVCARPTTTAEEISSVLQKTMEEGEVVLRRLAGDEVGMLEATRESLHWKHPRYRLRSEALKALGPAVSYHRRTTDEIDRKVISHVREYDKITNRTLQNLLDVSMTRAKQVLADLVTRELLVKVSDHERGPGVEYGRGPRFPVTKRRESTQIELGLQKTAGAKRAPGSARRQRIRS
jgi:ATP-dependent DNA helicase RecG